RRTIEVNVGDAQIQPVPTSRLGFPIASALPGIAATIRFVPRLQGHPGSGFRIRPSGDTIGAQGGPGELSVQTDDSEWDVLPSVPWITITAKWPGPGDQVLRYAVAQNDS